MKIEVKYSRGLSPHSVDHVNIGFSPGRPVAAGMPLWDHDSSQRLWHCAIKQQTFVVGNDASS